MTDDRHSDVLTPATMTAVQTIEQELRMNFSETLFKSVCMILMDYYCTVAAKLTERDHQ